MSAWGLRRAKGFKLVVEARVEVEAKVSSRVREES